MKILYVSNDINLGGAAFSLLDMISGIRKTGSIGVVVPGEGGLSERLRADGITYYIVPFERDFVLSDRVNDAEKTDQIFMSSYKAGIEIADIVRRESYDLIHTNSSVGNAGAFAALITGVPHVFHIRELMEEDFGAHYSDTDLKKALFHSSYIISISGCVRDSLYKKYGVQSKMIYNGIRSDRSSDDDVKPDRKRFILGGNITENKGQWDAVKAFEILKERGYEDLQLTVVGRGAERFRWEMKRYISGRRLDDCICLHEFIPGLNRFRRECGCCLVTSKMEALGRVTIEAMLAGQFVIGADTGGTRELIGDNERGFLYEQGNPESLASVIRKYMEADDSEIESREDEALSYAEKEFDVCAYADKLRNVYADLINEDLKISESVFTKSIDTRFKELTDRNSSEHSLTKISRNEAAFVIEKKWETFKDHGKSISDDLIRRGHRDIAIYGMGHFGMRLYDELNGTDVRIGYVIDKNPGHLPEICNVRNEDEIRDVDAVIVTVSGEEESIRAVLKAKTSAEVITLSEILS